MAENTCTVSGCGREHQARGLCSAHYQRWLKGSPLSDADPIRVRNEGPCSVENCERPARTKLLCVAHYARLITSGEVRPDAPVSTVRRHMPAYERTMADSSANESGCLEISPSLRTGDGYGNISVRGKTQLAHRIVWEHHNGPIPAGMVVRHRCDNPSCVLIDHLELGTQGDNIRDSYARNRRG